jgi:hypothetical protein
MKEIHQIPEIDTSDFKNNLNKIIIFIQNVSMHLMYLTPAPLPYG